MPAIVENVKSLLGAKPMFGICMGHQILGQAVGGSTFKLKFGHHGGNHPIRFDTTGALQLLMGQGSEQGCTCILSMRREPGKRRKWPIFRVWDALGSAGRRNLHP